MADERMEQAGETEKPDSCCVPGYPKPFSDSASSSPVSLSNGLEPLCTDRLGMVNCGMLSGVRIFGKMFSRLDWESDPREQPKDFALLVAHKSARIPALLCLRAVEKSSEALVPLQIAPILNVRVTVSLYMSECLPLSLHTGLAVDWQD